MTTKLCRKCHQTFPATLDFFYKNAGGKYGITPRCKPCVNKDNQKSHQERLQREPEKIKAQASARSSRYYHKDIDNGRKIARQSAAKRRNDPATRVEHYAKRRAATYGMTIQELEDLFASQDYKCAICLSEEPGAPEWNIDHCHKTGKVRFILCCHCNRGLGGFRDNPNWLRKAADLLDILHDYKPAKPSGS